MRIPLMLLIVSSLIFARPTSAQETPQALAASFIAAVEQRNRAALEGLIHPTSLAETPPDVVSRVINMYLRFDVKPSWNASLLPMDSIEGFNMADLSYRIGPFKMVFPVRPEAFVAITFTQTVPGTSGGKPIQGTLRGEKTRFAIAPYNQQWRIIIPDGPMKP